MTDPRQKMRDETGPGSAGQSGDLQQISDSEFADSESIEELVEEGNAFEADAVYGVESAPDPDVAEVRTRQIPEDDVPEEYLDNEP
jgi:N utilization substance protein A